ncbi:alpha/beta hydrolase [Mycoplasma sp. SG1]|uniref:alpha/beta hydrolase n=1 Tax=Mycoplasma sp. SG1 TaxID=2810348 RepID=UPI002024BF17|nr:alpha/beta hydrolase [Mycoplasma sp. SG1]URM53215.1 alpha/beta hydrolase [Mycoplasma sp. SG1]
MKLKSKKSKVICLILAFIAGIYIFANIAVGPIIGVYLPQQFASCQIDACKGNLENVNYLFSPNIPPPPPIKKNISSSPPQPENGHLDIETLKALNIDGLLLNKKYKSIPSPLINHFYLNVKGPGTYPSYVISGYTIKSPFQPSPEHPEYANHWVILVHGILSDWTYSLIIGLKLLELGINIVVYDNYSVMSHEIDNFGFHGTTGSGGVAFGLFEAYGLQAVYEKISQRADASTIGIYGASMGAATVMMFSDLYGNRDYVAEGSKLDYIIQDSGYASLMAEVEHVLWDTYDIPLWLVYFGAISSTIIANIWNPYSINPAHNIARSIVPMYFVQGTADTFVPYSDNFKPLLFSYYNGISLLFWTKVKTIGKIKRPIPYFNFTVLPGSSHADSFFWNRAVNNHFVYFFEQSIANGAESRKDFLKALSSDYN